MTTILYAVLVLGILGALFGVLLAIASHVFKVEQDPRIDQVVACLPGANCGGCGFPGCSGCAEAIVSGKASVSACNVGGAECAKKIAEIMGVEASPSVKLTAYVKCRGGDHAKRKYNYEGIQDCLAASKVASSPLECAYGCLGFGSCTKVCDYDAIRIENGVAVVHADRCRACGKCVAACPRHLISLEVDPFDIQISCSSHEKGITLRKICDIGCIGCSLCAKKCPQEAITIVDNLATIDYSKCNYCGECVSVCPRHLIINASETVCKTIEEEKQV